MKRTTLTFTIIALMAFAPTALAQEADWGGSGLPPSEGMTEPLPSEPPSEPETIVGTPVEEVSETAPPPADDVDQVGYPELEPEPEPTPVTQGELAATGISAKVLGWLAVALLVGGAVLFWLSRDTKRQRAKNLERSQQEEAAYRARQESS